SDMLTLLDWQARDGAWSYGFLHDARALTSALSSAEIERLLRCVQAMSKTHGPHGPIAVVVGSDLLYGMTRMYATRSESSAEPINVFRSVAEAEAWLDERTQDGNGEQ